jgi:hypothetical protein
MKLVLSSTLHLKISCGDEVLSAGRHFSHDQQSVEQLKVDRVTQALPKTALSV